MSSLLVRRTPAAVSRLAVLSLAASVSGCGGGGDGPTAPAPSASEGVSFVFCRTAPIWFAYQDATQPWTRATADANQKYSLPIKSRGGVAFVWSTSTGGFNVIVMYATAGELAVIGRNADPTCQPRGTKVLNGTIAGVSAGEEVRVAHANAGALLTGSQTSYTLEGVLNGRFDLVAVRGRSSSPGSVLTANKLIVRRGLDLPSGSSVPLLDFNSAEAVEPVPGNLTIAGLGADLPALFVSFTMDTSTGVLLSRSFRVPGSIYPYQGVPSSVQPDGALHTVRVTADPPMGSFGTNTRSLVARFRVAGDRTVSLGPPLATPTITPVSGSTSPRRYRMQLPVQSEYNTEVTATFLQEGLSRGVWVSVTAGYVGGTPGLAWDLTIPDLSPAGFDPDWGLSTATSTVWAASGHGGGYGGGLPDIEIPLRDGVTVLSAFRFGDPAPLSVAPARRQLPLP